MKKIIELNEELKNVKFLSVDGGIIGVDLLASLKQGDYYWDKELDSICILQRKLSDDSKYNDCFRIIIATSNLNLDGVPLFENNDDTTKDDTTWEYDLIQSVRWDDPEKAKDDVCYFINQNFHNIQQNMFTEEQVREAMKRCHVESDWNNIVQSIKQPKLEITFEDDKPISVKLV